MFVKNNKIYDIGFLIFLIFFVYFISRGMALNLSPGDDDYSYLNIARDNNIYDFLKERYFVWSGRISLDWLLLQTIDIELFWKIGIPLCILLISHSIWSLCLRDDVSCKLAIPGIAIFILGVTPSVAQGAMWWITGFYNYLLPLAFGFFSISIFKRRHLAKKWQIILSYFAVLFACFSEQVAILVIVSCIFILLVDRRVGFLEILFIFLATLCFCVLYFAPGNYHREIVEYRWFPSYKYFSFFQKITFGIDRVHQNFWNKDNLGVLILILSLILLQIFKKSFFKIQEKIVLILFFIFIFIFMLVLHQNIPLGFPDFDKLGAKNWGGWSKYVSYFFTLSIFAAVISCLFQTKGGIFIGFLFAISIALTIIIGLSPTVYGSGDRTLFLFNITLVLINGKVWSELLREQASYSKA